MHLHARPQPPNCKGCALSLINKQSDSHWKATNTCIANGVDWIQNPIDAFKIHVENRVFEYSFLKSQRQTYFYAITIWIEERSCPTVILVINIGPTNDIK